MGMIGAYVMVDPETIDKVQNGVLSVEDAIYVDEEIEDVLDIDKSWHIIHFALTGEIDEGDGTDPLRNVVVMDGKYIGKHPKGSALCPMYLSLEQVADTNDALQKVSEDEFARRFRQAEWSDDVYMAPVGDDADDLMEYAAYYFGEIKGFFARATCESKCIVFYIS